MTNEHWRVLFDDVEHRELLQAAGRLVALPIGVLKPSSSETFCGDLSVTNQQSR